MAKKKLYSMPPSSSNISTMHSLEFGLDRDDEEDGDTDEDRDDEEEGDSDEQDEDGTDASEQATRNVASEQATIAP
ncbi:hypothetical protein CTI12_AA141800 [Artemisia annua]|uniref:Uncharacterized protein n=1 Tax=Artemisia annua TaxID=35608 RepID=A0A2U1PKG4_ARTAN|nr:hypothetical protein CTI12_AA141800 [Artemisia annua]